MVFLALPPPLGFLLFPLLVHLGLHHILKQATHIHRHFHFLTTSYVRVLPINIGLFYLSLTYILFGVIKKSCSYGLSIRLAMICPQELVASFSRNMGRTFVSLCHKLCIHACYFLVPNIPFSCYSLHLSFSSFFDPLLDIDVSFNLEF